MLAVETTSVWADQLQCDSIVQVVSAIKVYAEQALKLEGVEMDEWTAGFLRDKIRAHLFVIPLENRAENLRDLEGSLSGVKPDDDALIR